MVGGMPSGEHESPIELAEQNPEVLVWLLAHLFDVKVSGYHHARPQPAEVRKLVPSSYRADGMTLLCDAADESLLAVVFEVQRGWDPAKRWIWKTYVAHLEAEQEVNAALLVYCPGPAVARRYRAMFESEGVSLHLRPMFFTPGDLPLIVEVDRARSEPALALLSLLCHSRDANVEFAFPAIAEALRTLGPKKGPLYNEIILAGLPEALWKRWEAYMTSTVGREYRSEFARDIDARARADAVLTVLETRGVHVSEPFRERIRACSDREQMDTWLRRAITATSIDDVMGD